MGFQILTCILILSAIFIGGFFWAQRIRFWSLVDGLWATSIGLIWIFLGAENLRAPVPVELWVLMGLGIFWSLRLTWHLGRRLRAHFPSEDPRYVELKKNWTASKFFVFFLAQAFIAGILSLGIASPLMLNAQVLKAQGFQVQGNPFAWIFLVGSALSLAGVFVSDRQLEKFKAKSKLSNLRGEVCQQGLWAYSRHPNYFFECLTWLFWGGAGLSLIWNQPGIFKFFTIVPGVLLTFLILKFTGIPYAESSSLKSRGEKYKDYQRRVSIFIPWFPKKKV